ncbi:PREDICTED: uncharacterized protein LOC105558966 [Vollenhovia emeryi]|uniref:uncharacterized protein LOC105558966 n=1 Tax=Vollenhovia emeryi TaxID=411798 RepID=UPI0005F4CDA0|nr:PREDICTED: uncharacterized protein LOC105558966 [Vollenhovia emeryi]
MPAEIDTGGHRVLHCDSRADCPTATSIRASTSASDARQGDRAYLSVRIDDGGPSGSQRRVPKDRRRRAGNCVRKAEEPLARGRGNSSSNHGESSPTRVPRIGDKEERILGGRDFQAGSRVLTSRRRGGGSGGGAGGGGGDGAGLLGACRAPRESPRAIEDVTKDERFSVTWHLRENAGDERAESRLRDETGRYRRAIADANGGPIARRRSLRDRSWTRPRPPSRESETPDAGPIDRPGGTPAARGHSLLSSHRSRTRANQETHGDGLVDVDEGFFSEGFDDARTGESGRADSSGRRDARPRDEWRKIGRDSANRQRIGRACRVYPFLRLVVLLFFIAFGRYGLLGSSSVLRVNARPIANGLSVLGIGIIGAVNARAIDPVGDAGIRAERSANLSYMTGPYRGKIQMYIKNRHLQILPDGTVNGSNDHTSDYTIFQRKSVGKDGQLTIQGIATCLYLCMDPCGGLYGSPNCTAECVFNETLEQHNYNTYSSVCWSTANRTLYLGLDRYGHPKKVQTKRHNLGRLSANARVLTQVAPPDRVEILQRRILGAQHKVRHWYHHRISDDAPPLNCLPPLNCPKVSTQEKDGRDRFRCRKRKKRKKRKRRCRPGEQPGPQCQAAEESVAESLADVAEASSEMISASNTTPESKRSCEGAASEEACRRQALSVPAKKRKSRIDGGGRNLTLGKNKAPTSNAKKPNVSVADNQSKKPDLTDGKKKRKRTTLQQTSRGITVASPSRKQYGPGTTSSSQASSSLTAPASEEQRASTATLSSSPSPPGASTALSSIRRPSSPQSDHKKPPSSRNHITRPIGSRRVGKSSRDNAGSPGRSRSMPATSTTSRSEVAFLPSTTKVPEDTCAYTTTPLPLFSPVPPSTTLSWQESDEDSSLVDEESSSTVTSELATVTVESSTLAASDEVSAEVTTFRLDEKNCEDSDDTIPRTTTRFPLERLAM